MTTAAVLGAETGLGQSVARALGVSGLTLDARVPPDCTGVVIIAGADSVPTQNDISSLSDGEWRRDAEAPILRLVQALQRAYAALISSGGRIVVVTPTIGIAGARSLVPYCTAIEGIRATVKSAARQWAGEGVIVNLVAVPVHVLEARLADHAAHLTTPAASGTEGLSDTIARTIEFLLSPAVSHLVGTTIVADGGSVMLP